MEAMSGVCCRRNLSPRTWASFQGLGCHHCYRQHSRLSLAVEGVQISSNYHSCLVLVWGGGHTLVLANPHTSQDSRELSESGTSSLLLCLL